MKKQIDLNPIDVHVGQKLSYLRAVTKTSRKTLSEPLGISGQQIQKYELGENRISASTLYKIAQFFDKPIAYFFEGYNPNPVVPEIKYKLCYNFNTISV